MRSAASSGTWGGSNAPTRGFPASISSRFSRPRRTASWPTRDQVFIILGASAVESPLPDDPNLRALVLAPERYIGKGVTITGRFRGANLMADLPSGRGDERPVGLRAAVGRRRHLGERRPSARARVRSRRQRADGHRPLAQGGGHRHAGTARCRGSKPRPSPKPPRPQKPSPRSSCRRRRRAVPEVVFSTPTPGETDAERAAPIRIQFSRDMDGKTFTGRVRSHATSGPAPPGAAATPPAFTVRYLDGYARHRDQTGRAARALPDGEGRPARGDPEQRGRHAARTLIADVYDRG